MSVRSGRSRAFEHNHQELRIFPLIPRREVSCSTFTTKVHLKVSRSNTVKGFIEAHLTAAGAQSPRILLTTSHSKVSVRSDASASIGLDQPVAVSNHPGRLLTAFDIEPRSRIDRAMKTLASPSVNGHSPRPSCESFEVNKHLKTRALRRGAQTAALYRRRQEVSSRLV